MKKVKVVCHDGPRSSSVPRPSPSRFHKNSFNPFETRVDSGDSGERAEPAAGIGTPGVRERAFACSGRETPPLVPFPNPRPSLCRKLIVSPPPIRRASISSPSACPAPLPPGLSSLLSRLSLLPPYPCRPPARLPPH